MDNMEHPEAFRPTVLRLPELCVLGSFAKCMVTQGRLTECKMARWTTIVLGFTFIPSVGGLRLWDWPPHNSCLTQGTRHQ